MPSNAKREGEKHNRVAPSRPSMQPWYSLSVLCGALVMPRGNLLAQWPASDILLAVYGRFALLGRYLHPECSLACTLSAGQ